MINLYKFTNVGLVHSVIIIIKGPKSLLIGFINHLKVINSKSLAFG